MYVYMYIYIYTHTHARARTHTHTRICIHVYIHIRGSARDGTLICFKMGPSIALKWDLNLPLLSEVKAVQ